MSLLVVFFAFAGEAEEPFDALKGKWLRLDGGYIIEIRSVSPDGAVDAAYFNPGPVNVETAGAEKQGDAMKVFIVLRDTGYPGSRYDLVYDAAEDRLKGTYYQAVVRKTYDIYFIRVK